MAIVQAFPYQGSKRKLAPKILEYIPMGIERFIEPFAGSAAMTIAVSQENSKAKFIINDSYKPLAELWDLIINDTDTIVESYKKQWKDQQKDPKSYYLDTRSEFNINPNPGQFLYLMMRAAKNAIRFNSKGEFNQFADGRRLGRKPDAMQRQLINVANLLNGRTDVFSRDYAEVLALAGPNDIVYMDPPYQGTSTSKNPRYHQGLDLDRFIDELGKLNERGVPFLVSFDGQLGEKTYGEDLPEHLNLKKVLLDAGRSAQQTLNGKDEQTYESLYISQSLLDLLGQK